MRLERLLKYVGDTTEMNVSSLMPLSGNFDCKMSKSGIYNGTRGNRYSIITLLPCSLVIRMKYRLPFRRFPSVSTAWTGGEKWTGLLVCRPAWSPQCVSRNGTCRCWTSARRYWSRPAVVRRPPCTVCTHSLSAKYNNDDVTIMDNR